MRSPVKPGMTVVVFRDDGVGLEMTVGDWVTGVNIKHVDVGLQHQR